MTDAAPIENKKRKRSGKAREEAKQRAIQAQEAAAQEADKVDEPAQVEAEAEIEADVSMQDSADVEEKPDGEGEGNDEAAPPKKRKRTGKMRAEAKAKAIAAKAEAAALAAANGEVVEDEENKEAGVDFEQVAKRIPQAIKKLHPVFKQSKKTESMRLIKKIKELKSKQKATEAAELEVQLKLFSAVQLNSLATTHLRQKLNKHRSLKRITLPEDITALLSASPSVPVSSSSATPDVIAKVENRLCSAKAVADAMGPAVSWILSEPGATLTLGAKAKQQGKNASAKSKAKLAANAADEDEDDDEGSIGDHEGEDEDDEDFVAELNSDDEAVIEYRAADAAGWESGSLGGGNSDAEDDASDNEDGNNSDDVAVEWADIGADMEAAAADAAGWESGSVGSGSESDAAPPAKRPNLTGANLVTEKPKKAPKAAEKPGKATGSSSMFLPSLAAGFAAGDSDSDPDNDYDPDGIIGTKKGERKNRRGQRARQAIWEKKYGSGAKHVVKAREEEEKNTRGPEGQRRDGGWGQRGTGSGRGGIAPESAPVLRKPWAAPGGGAGAGGRPGAGGRASAGPAAAAPKADADKELHPSWEAARLRKQREQGGAGAGAKATKIVFD